MKALVFEGARKLIPTEVLPAKPGPGQVLIKPAYVGLCYTEKHLLNDQVDFGWPFPTGQMWGHEFSGTVIDVGPGVDNLHIGDRVAIDPRERCGQCLMCKAGYPGACQQCRWIGTLAPDRGAGMAETCVVDDYMCYVLPDNVSMLAGALVEPMATATRAARQSPMQVGDIVVHFGCTDFQISQIQWSKLAGASQIILVDPVPARRAAAKLAGATLTIDPTREDAVSAIRALAPYGADVAYIDFEEYIPSAADYLLQAYDVLRFQGSVIFHRLYKPEGWKFSWAMAMKEISLVSYSAYYSQDPLRGGRAHDEYQITIDHLASGGLSIDPYQTEIVDFWAISDLKQMNELYDNLTQSAAKIALRIHGD